MLWSNHNLQWHVEKMQWTKTNGPFAFSPWLSPKQSWWTGSEIPVGRKSSRVTPHNAAMFGTRQGQVEGHSQGSRALLVTPGYSSSLSRGHQQSFTLSQPLSWQPQDDQLSWIWKFNSPCPLLTDWNCHVTPTTNWSNANALLTHKQGPG